MVPLTQERAMASAVQYWSRLAYFFFSSVHSYFAYIWCIAYYL